MMFIKKILLKIPRKLEDGPKKNKNIFREYRLIVDRKNIFLENSKSTGPSRSLKHYFLRIHIV